MTDHTRHARRAIEGRGADLLADRAVWGLTPEEAAEVAGLGLTAEPSFDLAAAAVDLAYHRTDVSAAMPQALRDRIEADALSRLSPPKLTLARRPVLAWAVAACATFAALAAWWPRAAPAADPSALRDRALAAGAGVWSWSDFNHPVTGDAPEIRGVRGDVVWSERDQLGYMRLAGLPRNDPKVERYQLWIIDERGLQQRVNGGVFDMPAGPEAVVAFKPDLPIHHAALFAVTIEKPDGVVVSDMSRRVCAAKPGG